MHENLHINVDWFGRKGMGVKSLCIGVCVWLGFLFSIECSCIGIVLNIVGN